MRVYIWWYRFHSLFFRCRQSIIGLWSAISSSRRSVNGQAKKCAQLRFAVPPVGPFISFHSKKCLSDFRTLWYWLTHPKCFSFCSAISLRRLTWIWAEIITGTTVGHLISPGNSQIKNPVSEMSVDTLLLCLAVRPRSITFLLLVVGLRNSYAGSSSAHSRSPETKNVFRRSVIMEDSESGNDRQYGNI